MPKKKFIDKKKAVTFHLVNRSLKDPLAVDETAPQKVLVPVNEKPSSKQNDKKPSIEKRKEEQQKYGIFFDDDYNYLQHLRDVNQISTEWEKVENPQETKINLPSSVFESNVEEKESFLSKSTPGLNFQLQSYDPDIIAALDEDFDFDDPDNILEDNFIELANEEGGEENNAEFENDLDDSDVGVCSDENDGSISLSCKFENEETKSRFTEYSMSSNIIRRNNQLTLLDDKFENMYISYDDNEIGALDSEEIEGHLGADAQNILQTSNEYEQKKLCDLEDATELTKNLLKQTNAECLSDEDSNETYEKMIVETTNDKNWDCESILSTYSNIYNHPKLISESKGPKNTLIEIDSKSGIPKNVLSWQNSNKLTLKNLAILKMYEDHGEKKPSKGANSVKSGMSILNQRPKNETLEEKKERKKLIKSCRRERRIERKMNVNSFKEEKIRQEKILMNKAKTSQERCIL